MQLNLDDTGGAKELAVHSRAQEIRHASDYDDFYIVSVEDAREQLEMAKEVVDAVEKYFSKVDQGTEENGSGNVDETDLENEIW